MKLLLLAVCLPCALLSACVDDREGEHEGRGGHDRGATLPSDAYYVGVPSPYRTVADCLAGGTDAAACTHEVAICASGTFGVRHGDIVTAGTYRLHDHHAVSHAGRHHDDDFDDHDGEDGEPRARFDFDVEAGQLVIDPAGSSALTWAPDYDGQWATAAGKVVDCTTRPDRR